MFDMKALRATLDQLEEERKIPREDIISAIEQALAAAYKKDYGKRGQIIRATFDMEGGDTEFTQIKVIVDETTAKMPEEYEAEELAAEKAALAGEAVAESAEDAPADERVRFDPEKHILLADALKINADAQLEQELIFNLEPKDDFGRIAAQTAKQVIMQRIREAEKGAILGEYADRTGEVVSGLVQKVEGQNVFVEFQRATGMLPKQEQIPGEYYRPGARLKVYLVGVDESHRGIQLRLSRTHPLLIKELFATEAPEIDGGAVEIKAIAREPGSRSKIAVMSHDENVDAIGACVGQKGVRVTTVMSELGGEKIDIIPWSADDIEFVASALSPARVISIELDDETHTAFIEVEEDQLSLAIGKGGQNVRLAAKLTGWRIDIQGVSGEEANPSKEGVAKPVPKETDLGGITDMVADSNTADAERLAEEVGDITPDADLDKQEQSEELADGVDSSITE